MASAAADALTVLGTCQRELDIAVMAYQAALLAARDAGATWPEMAKAMGTGESRPRHRYKAALTGGEMHITFPQLATIPTPRIEGQ